MLEWMIVQEEPARPVYWAQSFLIWRCLVRSDADTDVGPSDTVRARMPPTSTRVKRILKRMAFINLLKLVDVCYNLEDMTTWIEIGIWSDPPLDCGGEDSNLGL